MNQEEPSLPVPQLEPPASPGLAQKLKHQTARIRFHINPSKPCARSRKYWRFIPVLPDNLREQAELADQGKLLAAGSNRKLTRMDLALRASMLGELYLDVLEVRKLAKLRPSNQDMPPAEIWVTCTLLWPEDL